MATLTSLATDVYVLTNRPDLVAETRVALRKAIMKFHSADTFKRDLASRRLQMALFTPVQPNQFRWAIPLSEFPRFRRPSSLMYPLDLTPPQWQTPAPLIDWPAGFMRTRQYWETTADNLFDSYNAERQNCYFISGSILNIKSGWGADYLDFSYYQYPLVPTVPSDTITSWICDQYPDAVIEDAAGTVFKMIGKDDEYQRFMQLFAENLSILKMTDVGEGV